MVKADLFAHAFTLVCLLILCPEHLPVSPRRGYLWDGMCCADNGACAVPICGRRQPPSPLAAADVTDNYSIAAVKAALSHPIAQSVMKVTK